MDAEPGLTVSIDESLGEPVYRQVANTIRKYLVDGALEPGDRLPTVRQLAADLAVNLNTIAKAYRVLEEEGWVSLKRGRGAVVRERSAPQPPPTALNSWRQQLDALLAKAQSSGLNPGTLALQLREMADGLED